MGPFLLFVGLTGNGVEDSLILTPSMTCVRTWGLTTALGVTPTDGSESEGGGAGVVLGRTPGGTCSGGPLMLGGARLGMGGLTSLVSIGGPLSVGLVTGWIGVTVEVGKGVAVDIW